MIKDNLQNCAIYYGAHKNFEKAFDFIKKVELENLPVGKYEIDGKDLYASVQEYNSKLETEAKNEGHRNYIDIQYVVCGEEVIDVCDILRASCICVSVTQCSASQQAYQTASYCKTRCYWRRFMDSG